MTERRLEQLLAETVAEIEAPNFADSSWRAGRRSLRRRRLATGLVLAVIAVGTPTYFAFDHDDSVTGPTEEVRTPSISPSPGPGPDVIPDAVMLDPSMTQPFWNPDSASSLDRLTTVLPTDLSAAPSDPPSLAIDPVSAAVAVLRAAERPDVALLLGVDGRWRSLDISGSKLSDNDGFTANALLGGALSPDGRLLAIEHRGFVVVVDISTGRVTSYDIPRGSGVSGWSSDSQEVLIETGYPKGHEQVLDLATASLEPVPFDPGTTVVSADGTAIEFLRRPNVPTQLRTYRDGRLEDARYVTGLGLVTSMWLSPGAQVIAGVRESVMYSGSHEDPYERSGVVVFGANGDARALLPFRSYDLVVGAQVLGWLDDQTVLVRLLGVDGEDPLIAWNYESGQLRRVATVATGSALAVASGLVG